jgi:methylthioribose-1-phosphate isomerase
MVEAREAPSISEGDCLEFRDGRLVIIDQTALPLATTYLELDTVGEVSVAIKRLSVRGAMAIGVAGAYGVLIGALRAHERGEDAEGVRQSALDASGEIASSRPTARNLFWSCELMEEALEEGERDTAEGLVRRLSRRADDIASDTITTNRRLVEYGQELVSDGVSVMTHCNSGPLAALRYGTAVGVFLEAERRGRRIHVFACETRPLLQGARLTAWELGRAGVPYTLICDGAAAEVMSEGRVDLVMTGADRIAANGDTANKVGTYALAVLADAHGIPFYIAAPGSTVDLECENGSGIVIEQREPAEIRTCMNAETSPADAPVYNPAFDVTPARLIRGIVTERGILSAPYEKSLQVFSD